MLTLGSRLLALGCVALLGALLAHYPPGALWPTAALAAYAALLWLRPASWLFVLPALLPVLDFSAWTGWFYVREADFLVLATLAVGYWSLPPQSAARPLPRGAMAFLGLLACSYAISAYRGLGGIPQIDANAFASYQSPFNSIRVLLGFAWAILLLPLLIRGLGDGAENVRRYLFPGMLLGLGLAGLVVVWERLAFTGLMDFASDYRVTGSFSDMHVGGAALDGYLMLALPFAAVSALNAGKLTGVAASSLVFILGSYAALVTFSRSTQVAYVLAMAVVVVMFICRPRPGVARGPARLLAAAALALLFAYALVKVFTTGGYRTLAAAMGMLTAAFFAGTADFREGSVRTVAVSALLVCGATAALMAWSSKSVYFSYSAASLLLVGGLALFRFKRNFKLGTEMVLTSFAWLCLGTVLVAWHWGGAAAVPDALLAAAAAVCVTGYNRSGARPLWSLSKANAAAAALVALVLALTIPITGNYLMKSRFAATSEDFSGRAAHWRDALAMIEPGWTARIFGMGLGSFPNSYFWGNSRGEVPGVQAYRSEAGNSYLRLGGPRTEMGYGEALRVFQMIRLEPGRTYRLEFDARGNKKDDVIDITICEKWLLYRVACGRDPLASIVQPGEWQHFAKTVHAGERGTMEWFGRRPVHFALATEKSGTIVDVDNLMLLDETGRNLLRNGDFSEGHAWWFFSSDHHHLPWHAKNMLVHILFEQGWLGVTLIFLLIVHALRTYTLRALDGDLAATACLAALAGFLVVGLIDSLLDVPRLTLLFYMLLFPSLLPQTGVRVRSVANVQRFVAAD